MNLPEIHGTNVVALDLNQTFRYLRERLSSWKINSDNSYIDSHVCGGSLEFRSGESIMTIALRTRLRFKVEIDVLIDEIFPDSTFMNPDSALKWIEDNSK